MPSVAAAPPVALPTSEATSTAPTHAWPAPQPLSERERKRRMRDRRYFGEEVWGVSAGQRGATADAARLARNGLPVLRTEGELAAWLGIPLSRLRWYTHDRAAETTWHYVRYAVPKRGANGGERVILAPAPGLASGATVVTKGESGQ